MDNLKEKYLRPGRKITDQFIIASALSALIVAVSVLFIPMGKLALGFKSEEDFLNAYDEPDADGIAYQKNVRELLSENADSGLWESDMNIFGQGSGYMEMQGMYVICNMPLKMTEFFMKQQNGLLIIYALISLLVLCYIFLNFRWMKRHENDVQEDGEESTGRRFGFIYERTWSRRLAAFCIIMLIAGTLLSFHAELLSNRSQTKISNAQTEKLEKTIARENEERREQLDFWYNDTNMRTAGVASYILTRDEGLQNRETLKELGEAFGGIGIFMFDREGKTRVTNSDYDHIDLNEKKAPRMSATFLPLLSGGGFNASTPLTERYQDSNLNGNGDDSSEKGQNDDDAIMNEEYTAYAGFTIRNSSDLSDGCLGIASIALEELWSNPDARIDGDTYSTALDLASSGEQESVAITSSQLMLILITMLHLAICFILFYSLSVLRRDRGQQPAAVPAAAPEAAEAATVQAQDEEDLFYNLFGNQRDRYFHERWNRDNTPLRTRTPEHQLMFVARCILFALFLWIVFAFLTKGMYLDENSMIREVVRGKWERGMNLFAFTATEMIIIVSVMICIALHDLVYFIARFSTPRGETICHLVYSMITYATVFVALYYSLSMFGVHTSTILKGAGIVGLIVTFGAQGTIADILSGMFLIFENVIHVGDFIKVGDNVGVVKNIGVRMTKIQNFGTVISINNAELKALHNMSDGDARADCRIKIDNRENMALVREIIERELPLIEERIMETGYITSEIWFSGVSAVDESGITLRFIVFCISYRMGRVQRMLNEELIDMCQNNGIRLAVSRSLLENGGDRS